MKELLLTNVIMFGVLTALWKQGTWPNALIKIMLLFATLTNLAFLVKP